MMARNILETAGQKKRIPAYEKILVSGTVTNDVG